MKRVFGNGRTLELQIGDITQVQVEAIGNAANSELAGGGGVDGAIHRAGGPAIMKELDQVRQRTGGCPTGDAVATGAGDLPASYVFHAVGPVYGGGTSGEAELLASAYRACLRLGKEREVRSLSLPAISTGIYGYPLAEAAEVALEVSVRHLRETTELPERIVFVLFGKSAFDVFEKTLSAIAG